MTTVWRGSRKRNRYFTGKVLDAADFTAAQDYQRERRWLHNRWLHGYGVARGLGVSIRDGAVHVEPGLAIDARGEEIVVPVATHVGMPGAGTVAYLVIRYAERATDPVPVGGADGEA